MNKNIYLSRYWISIMNNNPDEEILKLIHEAVLANEYNYSSLLQYLGKILYVYNYSNGSIVLFKKTWIGFGMEEWEQCGISAETIGQFAKLFQNLGGDAAKKTAEAREIWKIFSEVDDNNPLKQALFNNVFNNLVYYGDYSDLDLIQNYTNYVANLPEDQELMDLPGWMRLYPQ